MRIDTVKYFKCLEDNADHFDKIDTYLKKEKLFTEEIVGKLIKKLTEIRDKGIKLVKGSEKLTQSKDPSIQKSLKCKEHYFQANHELIYKIHYILPQLEIMKSSMELQPPVFIRRVSSNKKIDELVRTTMRVANLPNSTYKSFMSEKPDILDSPIIGSGSQCKVFSGKLDGLSMAFKLEEVGKNLKKEAAAILASQHPNVVRPICYYICEQGNVLGLERGKMSLKEARDDDPDFILSKLPDFAKQMLQAVGYMHFHGIIHGDLKEHNMVVVYYKAKKECRIKLIDFGFSKPKDKVRTKIEGSPYYLSPRLLQMKERSYVVNEKDEAWAMGITLLNMICGKKYFVTKEKLHELVCFVVLLTQDDIENHINRIFDENKELLQKNLSEKKINQLKNLITALLRIDEDERVSPDEALQQFFKDDENLKMKYARKKSAIKIQRFIRSRRRPKTHRGGGNLPPLALVGSSSSLTSDPAALNDSSRRGRPRRLPFEGLIHHVPTPRISSRLRSHPAGPYMGSRGREILNRYKEHAKG